MKEYVKGKPIFTNINKVIHQYPYLTDNIQTDVLIVGGGVTGAICSYYFTKNNIQTVLIEKNRIGHLSTSVTTSLLQYELDDNALELKEFMDLEKIIRAYKLGLYALDEIEKFIINHGNNFDYIKRDTLLYTNKDIEKKAMKNEFEIRKENGFDVEYIDENINPYSFSLKAGVLSKNGGAEIDPYKFTHELLRVGLENGLNIYENTEAIKIQYNDKFVEVETTYGYKVKAKKIIVATGYNTDLFTHRKFATKSNTFNIATKPIKDNIGLKNNILIRDNEDPYNYLRTTKDKRLIIGGEDVDFTEIENEKLANKKYDILEQRLKYMFNHLKEIEIEYKYCGCFASTKDNLGFIGPDPKHKNLWYCLGYGANGILFAILGGVILSDMYNGKENKAIDLFKVDRFDN